MPKHSAPLPLLPRKPLVSIITSNLNHGAYLEDTILSVLEQDYDPIELIIVDGASKDNSLDILHKYGRDRRVRWSSEPDQGHIQALNKGLKLATGDIIGFQHSSDTYQPGAIKEAVQEFASDPFLAFVGGSIQITDARGLTTG
ncbi:MAG: glycosyltransferase, partial [Chloroflexi bacterium]|nr:glycosyltransferase [Chloroflexota bacterium]